MAVVEITRDLGAEFRNERQSEECGLQKQVHRRKMELIRSVPYLWPLRLKIPLFFFSFLP